MKTLLTTPLGRLRLLGFCEGITLIALLGAGMPLKYLYDEPLVVKVLGPIHGAFFLLFVFYAFLVGLEENWGFRKITLKLFIASFIPFGNFYVDHTILKPLQKSSMQT